MLGSVSIIIEWENVILAGSSRAARMLENVISQANQLDCCREIIVSANSEQPELETRPIELRDNIRWQVLINPECHYYELKNQGAKMASGEVVVFVDSDVIPERDWLREILAPFADSGTRVSCGRAYITPDNLYNRAFSLFWFFPPKPSADRQQLEGAGTASNKWPPTNHFFANNIAFKRSTAISHPFKSSVDTSRGACLELAKSLARDGIGINLNPRSLVAHPPPQPGQHFILRALAQGRDRYLRSKGISHSLLGSSWRLLHNYIRTVVKIAMFHARVGMPIIEIPAAWLIGLTYYTLYWVGEISAALRIKPVMDISI